MRLVSHPEREKSFQMNEQLSSGNAVDSFPQASLKPRCPVVKATAFGKVFSPTAKE
jgi:hypothetical protein